MQQSFSQETFLDGVKLGNNFILGTVAGVIVSIASIVLWLGIAVLTGPHSDFLAPGAGLLIGLTVRFAGRGSHPLFGILGGGLTLVSCVLSDILSVIESGTHRQLDFYGVLTRVNITDVVESIYTQATVETYVFVGIGVVLAALISIRSTDKI